MRVVIVHVQAVTVHVQAVLLIQEGAIVRYKYLSAISSLPGKQNTINNPAVTPYHKESGDNNRLPSTPIGSPGRRCVNYCVVVVW